MSSSKKKKAIDINCKECYLIGSKDGFQAYYIRMASPGLDSRFTDIEFVTVGCVEKFNKSTGEMGFFLQQTNYDLMNQLGFKIPPPNAEYTRVKVQGR